MVVVGIDHNLFDHNFWVHHDDLQGVLARERAGGADALLLAHILHGDAVLAVQIWTEDTFA